MSTTSSLPNSSFQINYGPNRQSNQTLIIYTFPFEGLGHFPTSILQSKIRKLVPASYACCLRCVGLSISFFGKKNFLFCTNLISKKLSFNFSIPYVFRIGNIFSKLTYPPSNTNLLPFIVPWLYGSSPRPSAEENIPRKWPRNGAILSVVFSLFQLSLMFNCGYAS